MLSPEHSVTIFYVDLACLDVKLWVYCVRLTACNIKKISWIILKSLGLVIKFRFLA